MGLVFSSTDELNENQKSEVDEYFVRPPNRDVPKQKSEDSVNTILLVGNEKSFSKQENPPKRTTFKIISAQDLKTWKETSKNTRVIFKDGEVPNTFMFPTLFYSKTGEDSLKHFINFDPLYLSFEGDKSGNLKSFILQEMKERILSKLKLSPEFSMESIDFSFNLNLMPHHLKKLKELKKNDFEIVFVN
jgi:hypothetical protein